MTQNPPLASLAAWLLDHDRELPVPQLLDNSNLAAYAYAALPPEHTARPALRERFLAALARHQRIRRELIPLLRRWNAEGIEPLIFKGFHLAEFVYPAPGMRYHGDVDLLVRPERASEASALARGAGWAQSDTSALAGRPYAHGVCSLYGPGGAACLDLHQLMLHVELPRTRLQRRVTEAVWARAERREWEGAHIHLPAPVDALLVGLVLQRCWGDRWQLKPHDVLDLRFLTERMGVSREALFERARELRVERTLSIFLERCDLAANRFELRPPSRFETGRWTRATIHERGLLNAYGRVLRRTRNLPLAVVALARALPSLWAAHRALHRQRDIEALLRSLGPRVRPRRGSITQRDRLVAGVLRGTRILPRNRDGDCILRSLAICHALWREGWPARFVSGVRREAGAVQGHAWVELDGRVLTVLYESTNRQRYSVLVEYPRGAAPGEPAADESTS